MILKQVFLWILDWGAGKLASWFRKRSLEQKRAEEIAAEERRNLERLKNAKTEKEVEDAAKDTLGL